MRGLRATICAAGGPLVISLCLSLGFGCKAKVVPPVGSEAEAIAVAEKIPEGTNALAALKQKDYEGAITILTKIQQSQPETEQQPEFVLLKQYVKNHLMEASATDPKAAEALNALRAMSMGR